MSCHALLALVTTNSPVTDGFSAQRASNIEFSEFLCCYLDKQLCDRWNKMPWHSWDTSLMTLGIYNIRTLQWRHNGHDSVSNHQPHNCLLNRLFRRRSKKISKVCVTGLCAGNSLETGEFPAQMASNTENVSIWWRHHAGNPDHHIQGTQLSFSNFKHSTPQITHQWPFLLISFNFDPSMYKYSHAQ